MLAGMSAITFHYRPTLRDPVLVLSFLGWNDAAESASGALRYLRRRARTEIFAEIDPDDFFVFTEQRPHVRLREGETREIRWPRTDFTPAQLASAEHDLILGLGTEPHLRWRAFSALVLEVAEEMGVEEVVTVGALLADTPHTRPVPLSGGAHPAERMRELGFEPSSYQGPTGIVGAIGDLCRRKDLRHVSLWASVPHYVSGGQNPRASQALLSKLSEIYGLGLDLNDLDGRARRYEAQVSEALQGNEEMQEYVARLESAGGAEAQDREEGEEPADGEGEEPRAGTPLSSREALKEIDRLLRGGESGGS